MADNKIPDPNPNPETEAFWAATAEGRLMLRYCRDCGQTHWYPRAVCPHCFGDDSEWRAASGRGTIYTYSITRRSEAPYAIAYVTLEEGPRMLTNIVDCEFDDIGIDKPVTVVFRYSIGGYSVPMFQLAE